MPELLGNVDRIVAEPCSHGRIGTPQRMRGHGIADRLDVRLCQFLVCPLDCVTGSTVSVWTPALADGATGAPSPLPSSEVGFNADVATEPPNAFSFGTLKRNKSKGSATLAVKVPGPGTLSLTGKGVKTQRPASRPLPARR